jgi:hypothetical protein
MPTTQNGTGHVELVFPNGSNLNITSEYSFIFQVPRTGDFWGNGAISGPLSLSQSQPLNVTVSPNVGNVVAYVNYLKGIETSSPAPIDLYVIAVYGDATVSVSGFGIAL